MNLPKHLDILIVPLNVEGLFHIIWNGLSTICGTFYPQYVEKLKRQHLQASSSADSG